MKFNLNHYLLVLFYITHINLTGQDEVFKKLINNMIFAIENHHQLEFEMQRNVKGMKRDLLMVNSMLN